ncbi:hypothetical protein ACFQ60_06740 [Streptomyces zhihengii]
MVTGLPRLRTWARTTARTPAAPPPGAQPGRPAGGAVPTASDSLDWLKERLYL